MQLILIFFIFTQSSTYKSNFFYAIAIVGSIFEILDLLSDYNFLLHTYHRNGYFPFFSGVGILTFLLTTILYMILTDQKHFKNHFGNSRLKCFLMVYIGVPRGLLIKGSEKEQKDHYNIMQKFGRNIALILSENFMVPYMLIANMIY